MEIGLQLGCMGAEAAILRSACGGLPLFVGFSGDGALHGRAGPGKARGSGDDFGKWTGGFREKVVGRIYQRADNFAGRDGRGLQGVVVIEHPAGQHGLGGLLDPLVDERGDFVAQIGSVIQTSEFKALQGRSRCCLQVVKRRSELRRSHGRGSNCIGLARKIRPVQL